MADQLSGCEADKVLGAPLRTIVECLAEVLPKGPAQTALYWVAGLCILAAPGMYKYYVGVLAQGAAPEGSLERQDYDKLRASLAGGNLAAQLYKKWLSAFLDGIERFFGDAGMADRTLFPRAFGLKTPAPLWTATAFDRCMLFAPFYPITTIFLIWAISGHVGPAEDALRLRPDLPGWRRGLAVAAIGFSTFAFWRVATTTVWKRLVWAFGIMTGGAAGAFAGAGAVGAAVFAAGGFAGQAGPLFAGARAGAGAVAVTVAVVGTYYGTVANDDTASFAVALLGLTVLIVANVVVAVWLSKSAIKYRWHGVFLSLFLSMVISTYLGYAAVSSTQEAWERVGPLLLFLVLLTLLNAPFDWASLGLTRALLRRGLEVGGCGPIFSRWWTRRSPQSHRASRARHGARGAGLRRIGGA